MGIATGIAIYFLIWWIVLFAVLPWGVKPQDEEIVPGSDPGAPRAARVWAKLIWTTVVATITFAVIDAVYTYRLIALEDLATWFGIPK